jgi:HTH-type transcriptional regulator/antitoxin HigA
MPEFKTPGQLLQSLLDERGWTQKILAVVLDTDDSGLNKIVTGKRPMDADLALKLDRIFDVPAERFLKLQQDYDLAMARLISAPDPNLLNRASLFGDLPVAEMIKRGWLPGVIDVRHITEVEKALCKFFEAPTLEEIEVLPHAAKKTKTFSPASPGQMAWLYRVKRIAREMLVGKYSRESLTAAISKFGGLLEAPENARKVPRLLADAGVRFVVVETLPDAKIDGVCCWLDDVSPVLGISLRHDRIDNFWFVLRHECEHILRGHGKGTAAMLDADLEKERAGNERSLPEEERVANDAAAEFCVSQVKLSKFIDRKAPFFAERDLIGFSRTLGVHPGLVAGQLQHKTGRYDLFRHHLSRIRSSVSPNAMVDGWGDVAPVD